MNQRTCTVCTSRPLAPGRTACTTCVGTLRGLLTDLPDKIEALDAAIGRRLHFGTPYRHGARSTTRPLPINMRAADQGHQARMLLLQWVDHIAHQRQEPIPDTWPDIQQFLDVRATWIAAQDFGPDAITALTTALRDIIHLIDRPADRHYAGPCTATTTDHDGLAVDCDGELYAATNRPEVQCPRCGAIYPVAERREWLLEQAWDTIATGPDIARALAGNAFGGITVNLSTLRRWASEGKLHRVDTWQGRPRYRIGDVVNLAIGVETKHANATSRQRQTPVAHS